MAGWSVTPEESAIIQGLGKESDRAVAIIGACILEDRIEGALKAKLRNESAVESDLFSVNRPLGTFSAKNNLGYLLRCYGQRFYRELETINTIRNRFAHYYLMKGNEVRDFDSIPIRDLCRNLTLVENYVLTTSQFNEKHGKRTSITEVPAGTMWGDDTSPILGNYRQRFITTVGLFTSYLGVYPTHETFVQLIGDEPLPSLSRRP